MFLGLCVVALFCTMDLPPFLKTVSCSSWPDTAGITKRSGLANVAVGKDPLWRNVVVYTYTVDGKEYVNDVIAYQLFNGQPGFEANQLRQRYSPGSAVTVTYNPNDPQDSCVDPRRRWDIIFIHAVMYILLAALLFVSCDPPYKPDESGFST